jgi:hypothetical protein
MQLDLERAVWIAIPAGTPGRRRRVSVAVSPRIEGTGTATIADLSRFNDWPRYFASTTLSLRVNGREVRAEIKAANGLQPDEQLWRRIFVPALEIDLVDPTQADAAATEHEMRTPVAPPTAETAAVLKQVYRDRVGQQAKAEGRPTTFRWRQAPPLGETEIPSWRSYIAQVREKTHSGSDDLHARAMDLMRTHELFHSRPPLQVYPDLIRSERDLDSPHETSFTRLPSLAGAPKEPPPAAALSARDAPLMVAAFPGDRIGRHAVGLRLRKGDQVDLRSDGQAWQFARVVVQVQAADNRATLYARHVLSQQGMAHSLQFRLPDQPPAGFTVTIRSLEPQAVEVVATAGGLREDLVPGKGKLFRWTPQGWAVEDENRQDFHGRVASLLPYPDLRRRLGLVIDLEVADDETLPTSGLLRVVPKDTAAKLDLCPWTSFEVDSTSGLFLPARRDPSTSSLLQGFMRNDASRSRFKIVQMDTDGAALAALHQARTQTVADQDEQTEPAHPVKLGVRGDPQKGGDLVAMRQIGLALCDTQVTDDTRVALGRAAELARALCQGHATCPELASAPERPDLASVPLFAEDLLLGFRVDILRRRPGGQVGNWRSLCEREGSYRWSGTPPGKAADWVWPDEGFVSQVADEVRDPSSQQAALRQSQALLRWDGWSPVAERPGNAFSETGSQLESAQDPNLDAAVRAGFRPVPGSLERFRLGDRDSLRLRTTDLCGNGLSLAEANGLVTSLADPRVFNSGCIERLEPLSAPILIPLHKPGEGEGNDQMVIRSGSCAADAREWLVLPPQASPALVELHGVLDHLSAGASWDVLRQHDDLPPKWTPETRGYDKKWIAERWDSSTGKLRMPYLPDPTCDAAVLRQEVGGGRVEAVARVALASKSGTYPYKIGARTLRLARGATPGLSASDRGFEIRLPPGRMAQLDLGCCPAESDLERFGLLNWCQCTEGDPVPCDEVEAAGLSPGLDKAGLQRACCSGSLGLVTPSRTLTLIHAVERPLLPEGRRALGFVTDEIYRFGNPVRVELQACDPTQGNDSGCSFGLHGYVWIDHASTGKLDFRIEWKDLTDDPNLPEISEEQHGKQAFQNSVALDTPDFVLFSSTSSAVCSPAGPLSKPTGCPQRDAFEFAGNVRFEDCFPKVAEPAPAGGSDGDMPDASGRFGRRSDSITLHIPARVPPALPSPVYMVPTFRFSGERKGHEVRTRREGGLRIFLQRDWLSSGEDEMLAVVFAPSRGEALEPPLDELLSVWGADSLWEPLASDTPDHDRLKAQAPALPERPVLGDVLNAELPVPSLITPLRVVPADAGGSGTGEPVEIREVELALAAYRPQLDTQKNLWFVDVDIKAPTYFTFLRLGLARYQPYSQVGCELSGLVTTAFSQLAPEVSVSVVRTKRRCYEVTVHAPAAYSETIERTFEVLVTSGSERRDHLQIDQRIGGKTSPLVLASNGDGEARWVGTVTLERWAGCTQLVVVEKQGWRDEDTRKWRIVGCVPVTVG